jgi:monofunctional biosynthetic peptidoglycan transglycosylase
MSHGHAVVRPAARVQPPSWLRRLLMLFLAVTVALPVGLIALFRFVPPPITPMMMLTRGHIVHDWVPLESISRNLVEAVIASEDERFCSHHGFDWNAIDKAIDSNAAGGRLRGASTISQQTAKNLFLLPDRTWTRKTIEAYLTVLLETLWPKRRILETYLNIAEWGLGRFGAEAAARANFGKAARQLTATEAARLATILPNPREYRADVPGPYVERQSHVILGRMAEIRRDHLDACVVQ